MRFVMKVAGCDEVGCVMIADCDWFDAISRKKVIGRCRLLRTEVEDCWSTSMLGSINKTQKFH